jgi:membrane-bound lytic murein transglycosylase D
VTLRPASAAALLLLVAACHSARPARPTPDLVPTATPNGTTSASALEARDASSPELDPPTDGPDGAEVAAEALRLFGDSAAVGPAESAPDEPTWDIDVRSYETHDRVTYYVRRFSGSARQHFAEQLSEGTRYAPMIRAKLRAAGLPEDLMYLALIESGFDVHAYSRAAAVGMWQFMTTTAKGTGLRVDWWVDQRRDPVASTDAAIKFLGWLNDQFGSLYLAAAAYNGGPGRVSRGLTRHASAISDAEGDDVFFALAETKYLRAETRDYVPKLIAAALVAKEPRRYGLTVERRDTLAYDSVRVGKATPLAAVAAAADVPVRSIMDLNPHLLRGMTPPADSFTVRLPVGGASVFDSAFAALPDSVRRAFRRLTSRKGETRASLARRAGITTTQLSAYNRALRVAQSGAVVSGQTVLVPTRAVLAAARNVPDPSVERYGSSSATHVVRKGESLSTIARRYRTSVSTLQRLNGLRKTVIYPGQVIVVRAGTTRSAASGGRATNGVYRVRSGDTLSGIAKANGVSVAQLKQLNGLNGDRIQVGQRLRVN